MTVGLFEVNRTKSADRRGMMVHQRAGKHTEGGGARSRWVGTAVAAASDRGLRTRLRHSELSAVAEIRAELRGLLRRRAWGGADQSEVAELLISDLVTNALVHTDRGAEVRATLVAQRVGSAAERLRVEVRDFVTGRPRCRIPDGDGTHGRGLLLVQALADAWGVRPQGTGKVVWFELEGGPT
jgi:anti-sigma regulatory factor (Ser/Thr protein kinase)